MSSEEKEPTQLEKSMAEGKRQYERMIHESDRVYNRRLAMDVASKFVSPSNGHWDEELIRKSRVLEKYLNFETEDK